MGARQESSYMFGQIDNENFVFEFLLHKIKFSIYKLQQISNDYPLIINHIIAVSRQYYSFANIALLLRTQLKLMSDQFLSKLKFIRQKYGCNNRQTLISQDHGSHQNHNNMTSTNKMKKSLLDPLSFYNSGKIDLIKEEKRITLTNKQNLVRTKQNESYSKDLGLASRGTYVEYSRQSNLLQNSNSIGANMGQNQTLLRRNYSAYKDKSFQRNQLQNVGISKNYESMKKSMHESFNSKGTSINSKSDWNIDNLSKIQDKIQAYLRK